MSASPLVMALAAVIAALAVVLVTVVMVVRYSESRHQAAIIHALADLVRAFLCPWRRR